MDDRSPGRAIGLQIDLACGHRPGHEIVQYDVKAQTGGEAVGGRGTQVGWAEAVSAQARDTMLRPYLRSTIRRYWTKRRAFVDHLIAGTPVVAARRCQQESLDAGSLGQLGKVEAAAKVYIIGDLDIEIGQWIVRECCQVQDRVKSLQVIQRQIAD